MRVRALTHLLTVIIIAAGLTALACRHWSMPDEPERTRRYTAACTADITAGGAALTLPALDDCLHDLMWASRGCDRHPRSRHAATARRLGILAGGAR